MAKLVCAETGVEINPDDAYISYEDGGQTWYFVDPAAFHAWSEKRPKPAKKSKA